MEWHQLDQLFEVEFLTDPATFDPGVVLEDQLFDMSFGALQVITEEEEGLEHFPGPYHVIPAVEAQTLPTYRKRMDADLEVASIPYYEVSNATGNTVIIGG